MQVTVALGKMQLSSSQKTSIVFLGAFLTAGIVLSTIVFPFWNLIREDLFEEVIILSNDDSRCYVETKDSIPKIIENCMHNPGDVVTVKYGKGLAWATVVSP